jgi:hypothetical protein
MPHGLFDCNNVRAAPLCDLRVLCDLCDLCDLCENEKKKKEDVE